MKSISIAGNIGKDAETRTTQNGELVTSWSVAVTERKGGDTRTIWFDCALWGKRGEALAPYLTKGGKCAVSGDLSTREHDGKTYLTIRAEQVTLLGGKPDGAREDQGGEHRRVNDKARQEPAGYGRSDMDQEIPF